MSGELREYLFNAARMKGRLRNVRVQTEDSYADHFFGSNSLALRLQSVLVLAGAGKSLRPLADYDAGLKQLSKGKRFFSTCVGSHFESQRHRVLDDILNAKWQNGTFMFVDDYGLQKNETFRAQLWFLNIAIDRKSNSLFATATFGHCTVLPLLPFEIVGVATIVQWIVAQLGSIDHVFYSWNFHSITTKETAILEIPLTPFEEIPDIKEVSEIVRLEKQMYAQVAKGETLTIKPLPRFPLSDAALKLADDLYEHWSSNVK